MCNCNKHVTPTECERLKRAKKDGRFIIYHISEEKGLQLATVLKGKNPNRLALECGFVNEEGEPEWFNVLEHPCNNE